MTHTVADAGLTQVFPVSTGKIQFFNHSRAVPWHQPSWMTQSTRAECIPMAPPCTSFPTLHLAFLLPYFPSASVSTQSWWQDHHTAWVTRNMAISQPHLCHPRGARSSLCAGLLSAQKHRLPNTCTQAIWARQSHGSRLLKWAWGFASPFRPWP